MRMRGVIVIERISGDDIRVMIARYKNKQLRHGIYQGALKGVLIRVSRFLDMALDGCPIPLGSTATHEPIEILRSL
jgi:hypothetical protein